MAAEDIIEHQFKPGESGNPNGRPKGSKNISTIIREFMDEEMTVVDPIKKKEMSRKISEIVVLKLIKKAIQDEDLGSIKELIDRLEGKAAQRIDFSGADGVKKSEISLRIFDAVPPTNNGALPAPDGRDAGPEKESGGDNADHSQ